MNHYGQLALEHWRRHRPLSLAALPDQRMHFTALGEQIQAAVTDLRDEILQTTPTTIADVRPASRRALLMAEEIVLTELVWQPEELSASPSDADLDRHYRSLQMVNDVLTSETI